MYCSALEVLFHFLCTLGILSVMICAVLSKACVDLFKQHLMERFSACICWLCSLLDITPLRTSLNLTLCTFMCAYRIKILSQKKENRLLMRMQHWFTYFEVYPCRLQDLYQLLLCTFFQRIPHLFFGPCLHL